MPHHADAEISDECKLAPNAAVEKGAIIKGAAEIGEHTTIGAYSVIWSGARIGANNRIFPFCSLGGEPQDKKYQGEESLMIAGNGNTFREYCIINGGTKGGGGKTVIGDNNLLMAYSHLAHDCILGSGAVIANAAQIAGHVKIGDHTVIGGGALIQQFVKIGAHAMIGGGEKIRQDIPPYAWCAGGVIGVNKIGMQRRNIPEQSITQIRRAFKVLYRSGISLEEATRQLRETTSELQKQNKEGAKEMSTLCAFLSQDGLNLIRPRHE